MKIKEFIKEIIDEPSKLDELAEEEYSKLIKYLQKAYFNKNTSLVSDKLFDYIKDNYETKFKKKLKDVGATIMKNKTKIKLPHYMGSLDKIKPSMSEFTKWVSKYSGPYILSYKLDGISALVHKIDNKISMYTRGNGVYGQDISHVLEHININTSLLKNNDAIRGELIISKKNFVTIKEKMANARNAVSGIINTKNPDKDMLKLIDFVAYWVIEPELKQSEQIKYIKKKEITMVDFINIKQMTIDFLSEMLSKGRKEYKYEIDGIVVIDDSKIYTQIEGENPDYGFAFKQVLTDQIAETIVVDVLWEISKDGYLKPKIKIETVELLGSEITYATAFNAKYIFDNNIGPGSVIKIIKSGDVIPYINEIMSVSENGKPKMPSIKYKWNETNVDIIAQDLDEENMRKIIIKKLLYFFESLDIKFMGEGMITKFVEAGYDDLWKILEANKDKLSNIDGLGKKSVDKIYESINEGIKNRHIYDLMAASQIFGRGIGSRKFKLIIDVYPNIIDIFNKEGYENTLKLINTINGFENKTSIKVVDNLKSFETWLNNLLKLKKDALFKMNQNVNSLENDAELKKYSDKIKDYSNKTIVFTGFRDKDVEVILEKLGTKITNSISKNTDILVASNPDENTAKINKAKELDVKIISKEQFYKLISK
jgi:NAD-dependent DNA ligase